MDNIEIVMPNTTTIEAVTTLLVNETSALAIVNHGDYLRVGEFLKRAVQERKKVVDIFAPIKAQAHKAHAMICETERKILDPIKKVEVVCNASITPYILELRRKEEAENNRRQAEAEAEAKRRAEDAKLAAAEAVSKNGDAVAAMKILEQDIIPEAAVAVPVIKAERIQGQHIVTTYNAEVTDLMALVKAVAAGLQPLKYLEANQQALNKIAKALKEEAVIPGVKILKTHNTQNRS